MLSKNKIVGILIALALTLPVSAFAVSVSPNPIPVGVNEIFIMSCPAANQIAAFAENGVQIDGNLIGYLGGCAASPVTDTVGLMFGGGLPPNYEGFVTLCEISDNTDHETLSSCLNSPNFVESLVWVFGVTGFSVISGAAASGFLSGLAAATTASGSTLWAIVAIAIGIPLTFVVLNFVAGLFPKKRR